jgi:hypothetical protein
MWQDYVISIVNLSFSFMLIPQLISSCNGHHVNMWTSGLTTIGLLILLFCFATLDLSLSVISTGFCAGMWLIIFTLAWIEKTTIT